MRHGLGIWRFTAVCTFSHQTEERSAVESQRGKMGAGVLPWKGGTLSENKKVKSNSEAPTPARENYLVICSPSPTPARLYGERASRGLPAHSNARRLPPPYGPSLP